MFPCTNTSPVATGHFFLPQPNATECKNISSVFQLWEPFWSPPILVVVITVDEIDRNSFFLFHNSQNFHMLLLIKNSWLLFSNYGRHCGVLESWDYPLLLPPKPEPTKPSTPQLLNLIWFNLSPFSNSFSYISFFFFGSGSLDGPTEVNDQTIQFELNYQSTPK